MRERIIRKAAAFLIPVILLAATACAGGKNSGEAEEETSAEEYYDMEFHRGGRDARPENTLYSYQYALENGASTIECDVRLTADGQLVMSHNPSLNPDITTDAAGERVEPGRYYICDMTFDELQAFNVGIMD